MNRFLKVLIATLGGINTIFSIFVPGLIALLIISTTNLNQFNQIVIIVVGMLSTLYRTINIAFMK